MITLPMPPALEGTAEEQLVQLRSYLRKLVGEIENQINMSEEGNK